MTTRLMILRWGIILLIGGYALAVAVLQLLWRTSALNIWWVSLLNVFGLWLYVPLPFLLLLGLLVQPRAIGAALIVPLVCFGWEYAPLLLTAKNSAAGTPLRVMTWNVLYSNSDVEAIDALIREHDPDVLALQEYGFEQALTLEPILDRRYPYRASAPGGSSGLGVWSRYPILDWWARDDRRSDCACQRMVLDINGDHVRFVNAHPRAPKFTFRHYLAGVRLPVSVLSDFRTAHQQPALDALVEEAARGDRPLILVGDLNTGDRQPNYWRLRRHLVDAYRVAGRGFGLTFPNAHERLGLLRLPLLVRIDYIFQSPSITAARAFTAASPSSDHRAVVADLRVPVPAQVDATPYVQPRSSP
ncbi:MAG TPA: endonuclease/exonuclease/phosphatase family protein [Herpetosiphonaceae bacterium]|nr:endonuclease/exonuclease/phosphatase family protein [Herpetosiphonaceae bacterium]